MTYGPPEVRALIAALPEHFALTEGLQGLRGRCIEATRIAIAAWKREGVQCHALACDLDAVNAPARLLIERNVPAALWPPDAWAVAVRCDWDADGANLDEPTRRKGFGGHLVVVGDDWFADLTVAQVNRPRHGIHVRGAVLGPYTPRDDGVEMALDGGGALHWHWRPEVKSWRTTPAWRQDIPRTLSDAMAASIARHLET